MGHPKVPVDRRGALPPKIDFLFFGRGDGNFTRLRPSFDYFRSKLLNPLYLCFNL